MSSVTFSIWLITFLCVSVECIQNGEFISILEAPYYASLVDQTRDGSCGAAILSDYWLVSAGHCVANGYEELEVRTGATRNYSNGTIHTIENVVIPKNYTFHFSKFTKDLVHVNDISLIKLKEPIKFDEYQQPIKLRSTPPKENDTVTIVGLGLERILNNPPSLKKTVQSVAATAPPFVPKPPGVFHLQNSTSHFCPGDSGSPGVIDNKLAGIAVFVDEMCMDWSVSHNKKYPGALTRIDIFYNWILNHTEINN
ncbi:chymotrypsin-1-like isoform X2 [Phymastichus coffea]|uniref:chymotrypsin-1-like isoform X2 n=1 Tax=Phymastichus coffea TaxID=108790 RepID=UPI00273B3F34|nr:chymotrypsin-1-like isoform X2 [Phymastichus coffea]